MLPGGGPLPVRTAVAAQETVLDEQHDHAHEGQQDPQRHHAASGTLSCSWATVELIDGTTVSRLIAVLSTAPVLTTLRP